MGVDTGTVGGYDAMVSISNEAILRQLEVLYETEVKPYVAGGPKYLIDRELHLHETLNSGKPSRRGIDGYICCPQILLNPTHATTGAASQTARIGFKFRQGTEKEVARIKKEAEAAEKKKKPEDQKAVFIPTDSLYTYQNMIDDDTMEWESVPINGWEMSWDVLVTEKEVPDVMSGMS
jgi:hypothetical protein